MTNAIIRTIAPQEYEQWLTLYTGYIKFCGRRTIDYNSITTLWNWIRQEKIFCSVAIVDDEFVGLMHTQELYSPLNGRLTGYLEDFFVTEAYRGTGIAQQLIDNLKQLGKKKDWLFIRWKTKETNLRAQAFHNKIAKKTPWITYQINLE
ncbi:hypothetical protein DKL61_15215 [Gammaproteobacteria bacterium ESL0073]|nr:hypothetical protein DKL61_15215 [Gammaproteobacteria bacterium ESL0073]